jgi:hypothetical protein
VALGQAANAALRADLLASIDEKAAPFFAAMPAPSPPAAISDVARQVLKDQLAASGLSLYRTLTGAAGSAATPPAAGAATTIDLSNFDKLDAISLAAEVAVPALTPALRIGDNEVTLTTGGIDDEWGGIVAILSTSQLASVIVNGNRVLVPNGNMPACAVEAAATVVTGNLFLQPAATFAPATVSCLIVMGTEIMVSANVAFPGEMIIPQRTAQAATTSWDFLNTLG